MLADRVSTEQPLCWTTLFPGPLTTSQAPSACLSRLSAGLVSTSMTAMRCERQHDAYMCRICRSLHPDHLTLILHTPQHFKGFVDSITASGAVQHVSICVVACCMDSFIHSYGVQVIVHARKALLNWDTKKNLNIPPLMVGLCGCCDRTTCIGGLFRLASRH